MFMDISEPSWRNASSYIAMIVFIAGGILLSPALAIQILGDDPVNGTYDAKRHSRWYTGSDKDFLGAVLGMSGVSRSPNPTLGNRNWSTMISDTYFISAKHLHNYVGDTITFHETDSLSSTSWSGEVIDGFQLADTDIWIGQLDSAPPSWVHRFPLLKRPGTFNYLADPQINSEIYVVGRDHAPNTAVGPVEVRVGRNRIEKVDGVIALGGHSTTSVVEFAANQEFVVDEAATASGDSGGPSFTVHTDLGPALVGIHLAVNADSSVSNYVDEIVAAIPENIVIMTDLRGDINGDFKVDGTDYSILTSPSNYNTGPGKTYNDGDLNLDGYVDVSDFSILSSPSVYGKKIVPKADFNDDQVVNEYDFAVIAANWNSSVAVGTLGDANSDGFVDRDDVVQFGEEWLDGFATPGMPLVQIPGDANFNGRVWLEDLQIMYDNYNEGPFDPYTSGDVNGDGYVDISDFSIISSPSNWGNVYADVNDDGAIDIGDVDVLATFWHQSVSGKQSEGDINEDGYVDSSDLAALGAWWQVTLSTAGNGVPEPGTMAMAGLSLIGLAFRRRLG